MFCRYGGIYLDSDIIVLKPISSLSDTVGLEDELNKNVLNGAVMAFPKHRLTHPCFMHFSGFIILLQSVASLTITLHVL